MSQLKQVVRFAQRYCPLACICLALCLTNPSFADDTKISPEKLEQLKANIQKLRKELEATRSSRDKINNTLEKTEKHIGELSKKAKKIEGQLQERREKLDALRDERSQLQKQKQQQEGLVGDYINAAYRLGQQSNLRLLLNQEDPARVSRNLRYYDYFAQARAEKIHTYMSTIERINRIEPEIAYQTAQVQRDLDTLNRERDKLRNAQADRKHILSTLNARIQNQDQQLRAKQEDRRRLEKLLTTVIENVADLKFSGNNKSFAQLKGQLPWPTRGKVVRPFGSNRVTNKMRWEGMLIQSNAGEPVHAVHYGRVVFSDYLRGHGLLIIIDHGAGFMSLYAHNQALYKELGEWVVQGDIIASVGNSGGQQQAALYFELRRNGKPTNPKSWLRRA